MYSNINAAIDSLRERIRQLEAPNPKGITDEAKEFVKRWKKMLSEYERQAGYRD